MQTSETEQEERSEHQAIGLENMRSLHYHLRLVSVEREGGMGTITGMMRKEVGGGSTGCKDGFLFRKRW